MRFSFCFVGALSTAHAFTTTRQLSPPVAQRLDSTQLNGVDRRQFGEMAWATTLGAAVWFSPSPVQAQVFFDPAMYGDQELRVSAVDSVKERVRRAILRDPKLAPSFYELALLDGLSYDAKTNGYGPNGSVLSLVFASKATDEYTANLQQAASVIVETEQFLRKKNAVSVADAIAIAGAEAVESVGGPVLTVQLGRSDTPKNAPLNPGLPLNLLSGDCPSTMVADAFRKAGLTEREMTAILTALLTLRTVEKSRTTDDWKQSSKPKFREPGKIGRMSEFRRLTEEDIAEAQAQAELDAELEDPDDGWYIADTFGTRESRFGERIGKDDIDEKSFNKYIKVLDTAIRKKDSATVQSFGWIATLLVDPSIPTAQTWLSKYAGSNLNYRKDLDISYNAITQLGAVYTGGKYESLLKGKPRKSLNDNDMKLF